MRVGRSIVVPSVCGRGASPPTPPKGFGLARALTPILVGAAVVARAGAASAQAPKLEEFSVQRFEPAPGPDNFLGVETLRMEGGMRWSAGLFFNYARDPFVVHS